MDTTGDMSVMTDAVMAREIVASGQAVQALPQYRFRIADQLFVRAAELRYRIFTLQTEVDALKLDERLLERTAAHIHRLANVDRERIANVLDANLTRYRSILPTYTDDSDRLKELGNIKLAVEEGRAMSEDVEDFVDRLATFAKSYSNDSDVDESTDDEDNNDKQPTTSWSSFEAFGTAKFDDIDKSKSRGHCQSDSTDQITDLEHINIHHARKLALDTKGTRSSNKSRRERKRRKPRPKKGITSPNKFPTM